MNSSDEEYFSRELKCKITSIVDTPNIFHNTFLQICKEGLWQTEKTQMECGISPVSTLFAKIKTILRARCGSQFLNFKPVTP